MACSCMFRTLIQSAKLKLWLKPDLPQLTTMAARSLETRDKLLGRQFSSDVKSWRFLPGYEDIPELHIANDNVKRIFSLDHGYEKDIQEAKLMEERNKYSDPLEQSIATLTITCNNLLSHCQTNKKDKANKTFYIFMLDQRKGKLKALQRKSPERYLQLISDLGLPALKDPSSPAVKYRFRSFKRNVPLKKKRELHELEEDRMY